MKISGGPAFAKATAGKPAFAEASAVAKPMADEPADRTAGKRSGLTRRRTDTGPAARI
ncbi:MAG: hypothetical protein ABSG78_10300 [Verrucomicrobiota bacterium]